MRADVVVRKIIEQCLLRKRADYILIDAGPLLPTGDAIVLSAHVDAMVPVVGLRVLPLGELDDLARVLDSSPAATLGFVVTGADDTLQRSQRSSSPRRGNEQHIHGDAPSAGVNGNHRENGAAESSSAHERWHAGEH